MDEIIGERVYLSNFQVAQELSVLQLVGITHILNVTKDMPCAWPNHFHYKQIKV